MRCEPKLSGILLVTVIKTSCTERRDTDTQRRETKRDVVKILCCGQIDTQGMGRGREGSRRFTYAYPYTSTYIQSQHLHNLYKMHKMHQISRLHTTIPHMHFFPREQWWFFTQNCTYHSSLVGYVKTPYKKKKKKKKKSKYSQDRILTFSCSPSPKIKDSSAGHPQSTTGRQSTQS